MIVKAEDLPERFDRYAAGQDFGLNTKFVKIGWLGDTPQNLYNKMKRNNLSEKELWEIAEALDCSLKIFLVRNKAKGKI